MKRGTFAYTREIAINVVLSLFFLKATVSFIHDYMTTARISSLLFVIFLAHFAIFSLIRRIPKEVSTSPAEWIAAIGGTFMMALWLPSGDAISVLAGSTLQCVGLFITCIGLWSLNLSYAVIPANRGIRTSGLYRYVRHPLYIGYILSDIGMILSQFSWHNVTVVVIAVSFLILRIRYEEAFLLRDPAYQEFVTKTRYRLVPYIW